MMVHVILCVMLCGDTLPVQEWIWEKDWVWEDLRDILSWLEIWRHLEMTLKCSWVLECSRMPRKVSWWMVCCIYRVISGPDLLNLILSCRRPWMDLELTWKWSGPKLDSLEMWICNYLQGNQQCRRLQTFHTPPWSNNTEKCSGHKMFGRNSCRKVQVLCHCCY